ncbi:hypothetical protein R4473_15390 [Acinetobacter baumannii]|uniref:hypothetical protein n=1 Tax=Acinetobacter baumannii TaxID=470 RepID=UPI00233FEE65|nr:hypothetical protein [Acinetobacter baumannii]MDC5628277.1 hypothetical protein [Acinetobacter baumannii]MDO7526288.1 hypothetical protein [Acinetobacter baumannii]MDV4254597.1 hypothetical protein [Acinetobacter baumannii]MDV7462392.1 hypothetical protein [Acinetobacter baumannii]HEM7111873.1 hypothetical protein [Acinetobacter baumannii]
MNKINNKILLVIREILHSRSSNNLHLVKCLSEGNCTKNEYQELMNLVAIELYDKGFDDTSELTSYGLELEKIIDQLNHLIWQ